MSDDLSIQGTLAESTVPDLFRSLIRSKETAIVTLEGIGRHDNTYFVDGEIVFATSSDPDLGLAEILLREGELDLEQYTRVNEELFGSRRPGALLCTLGYLQPDELSLAVERQVVCILHHILTLRSGSYTIEFTSTFSSEVAVLHLNTERLILDGVGRIENWSLIQRGIGRAERLLRQNPRANTTIYHLDLTEEESHIYGLLSVPLTVRQLCEQSYLSNFLTCRTLWALLAADLIEDGEEGQSDEDRTARRMEMELESTVERYNEAFQSIFKMVFQIIGDHTWDFTDRVVLHVSPELFPYLNGMNLTNEGRVDFDQLLNNLISSGYGNHQPVVEKILDEILSGWVQEIRGEFGNRVEDELGAIVRSLKG